MTNGRLISFGVSLAVLLLLLSCGDTASISVAKASGPMPFPAIPTDGTPLVLNPGIYTCPTSIPTGAHIIGRGSVAPPELVGDIHFAPFSTNGTVPAVRISCNGNLVLRDVAGVQISGLIFDFNNTGGLVLEA